MLLPRDSTSSKGGVSARRQDRKRGLKRLRTGLEAEADLRAVKAACLDSNNTNGKFGL